PEDDPSRRRRRRPLDGALPQRGPPARSPTFRAPARPRPDEPALEVCRDAGDRHESSYVLAGLASIDLARDNLAEARWQLEQTRAVRDEIGEMHTALTLRRR